MRRFAGLASLLVLAACAVGPDHVPPATPASAAAPFIGSASPAVAAADEPAGRWWQLYQDPLLDRLVADALAANKDIAVATANLAAARALLREERAGRLPTTTVGTQGAYQRLAASQTAPGADRTGWAVDAGFEVGYELDLFGRVGRRIEAARGDAEAAEAARDTVRVAIAAETARAYADLGSFRERIAVAERSVALLDQTVKINAARYQAGRATGLDTSRAAALRDQVEATVPPLVASREAALFRLATLTGRAPRDLPAEVDGEATVLRLDRPLPIGDGRALLARRPDVREAERRLAAATARIGVATADLYPTISLGGSIGSTGTGLASLLAGGPLHWLLGGLLSWSFPNQEAIRARIANARAEDAAALARFDAAVLNALEETETALSAYAHELERRQSLAGARDAAQTAARIVRAQLREGSVDSLSLVDANRTLADAEAELAASDARVVTAQVDLFRALGGGWQDAEPSPPR